HSAAGRSGPQPAKGTLLRLRVGQAWRATARAASPAASEPAAMIGGSSDQPRRPVSGSRRRIGSTPGPAGVEVHVVHPHAGEDPRRVASSPAELGVGAVALGHPIDCAPGPARAVRSGPMTAQGPRPDTASRKVLVVDDEPAMVGVIGAILGGAGHRIVAAYDGVEALRRFREEDPDVVLLDLAMPGLDGALVCREIRAISDAPIIIVSGERDLTVTVELLDAGADDYIRKPFRGE